MYSCLKHANVWEKSYLDKNVGCCVSFWGEYRKSCLQVLIFNLANLVNRKKEIIYERSRCFYIRTNKFWDS